MPLPLLRLQPISQSHYYTSGDVTIQAGVAIAPGVLIQADPNSRVIIKTGVCIGIGAIVHANHGTLEIGEGANIGAEALLVGQLAIGAHACIGAATTIFNTSIAGKQIVPPGSLLGDLEPFADAELQVTDTTVIPPPADSVTPVHSKEPDPVNGSASEPESASGINVYGQVYVNRLLVKMFPHRNQPPHQDAPASDDPWQENGGGDSLTGQP
jgi:carbon dioxide concentrating mechanism protein CcmN